MVSHSLHVIWLWISVFAPIYCRRNHLWSRIRKAVIYDQNVIWSHSVATFFQWIWFYPRSLGCLVLDSLSPKLCLLCSSYGVDLNPNQIFSGCFHKLCATTAPACCGHNTIVEPRLCGWLGIHAYFLVECIVSYSLKMLVHGGRGTRSTSPCSVSCVGVIFSNRVVLYLCEE